MNSTPSSTDTRELLRQKLAAFTGATNKTPATAAHATAAFRARALDFFDALGYKSERTLVTRDTADFRAKFDPDNKLIPSKSDKSPHPDTWLSAHLLFQLTDENISPQASLLDSPAAIERSRHNSYIFLAIELDGARAEYPRSALAAITRRLNRVFPQPVMVLLKTGKKITLSVINRRPGKLDADRDILGKVTLIRDIDTTAPHRGHLDILADLALPSLRAAAERSRPINSFDTLHAAWEKLLNIQLLNKSFYKRLNEWYEKCLADIQIDLSAASRILGKDIDNELKPQAVIRVIIRLMFMWFMKEKGLVDGCFFTRKFAAEFVEKNNGYYNAILQNLFFAVLNKKITERRFRNEDARNPFNPGKNDYGISDTFRHKTFFKPGKAAEFLDFTKKIPFVNGGLFVCHDHKFSGKDTATNRRNTSGNYIIDGFSDNPKDRATIGDTIAFDLLDLFGDYVFTLEESTPTEQDIALDPELLGTVFENLIGSYNPETKENARKQTGSFYTPREIVDYMCQESLKESLSTQFPGLRPQINSLIDNHEDQLNFPQKNSITAAITSLKILDPACGSGAFPMGMFLLMVRTVEKLQERKTTYKNKLEIIQNCIYGVDIQNIAIEISKLRFFISLLVDYPVPGNPENFEVLPNLETKFAVANTLVGLDLSHGDLFARSLSEKCNELTAIFTPFTTARTPHEKASIKNAFESKKQELVALFEEHHFAVGEIGKIRAWNPFNVCYCSPFFDSGIIFGITNGFDIIIGNPPYVEAKKLKGIASQLKNYAVSTGTSDLSVYFIEKGSSVCKANGWLCYITTNKFFKTGYGKPVRKFLISNQINQIVDFEQVEIFDNALVSSVILGLKKSTEKMERFTYQRFYKLKKEEFTSQFVEKQTAFGKYSQKLLTEDEWSFPDTSQLAIKEKIEKAGARICNLKGVAVFRGVTTGYNPAFIIDKQTKDELIAVDKNNQQIIKPLLEGENIRRWIYTKSSGSLLQTGFDANIEEEFPSIFDHLVRFMKKLKNRDDQGKKWWNLRACKYYSEFEKPEKIIWGLTADKWAFAFDDKQHYLPSNGYILTSTQTPIKYLLALLNSNVLKFYFGFLGVMTAGGAYTLKHATIQQLPIPDISSGQQQPIITLVDRILAAKLTNPATDIAALESEIDHHVYTLYNLTNDEIKIVEGKA